MYLRNREIKIISAIILVFGVYYFFVETAFFDPKNPESGELATTSSKAHIQPPLLETQNTIKKPTVLEQPAKKKKITSLKKSETTVHVMQEYHPDLKSGTEKTNDDMPALYPDEFGNETYDPSQNDIELSIGEFIPVEPLEAQGNDKEISNFPEENSPQDPDTLLVEMGEMITFEEKNIGEPISVEDIGGALMDDAGEAMEIGDYKPATSFDLD